MIDSTEITIAVFLFACAIGVFVGLTNNPISRKLMEDETLKEMKK